MAVLLSRRLLDEKNTKLVTYVCLCCRGGVAIKKTCLIKLNMRAGLTCNLKVSDQQHFTALYRKGD